MKRLIRKAYTDGNYRKCAFLYVDGEAYTGELHDDCIQMFNEDKGYARYTDIENKVDSYVLGHICKWEDNPNLEELFNSVDIDTYNKLTNNWEKGETRIGIIFAHNVSIDSSLASQVASALGESNATCWDESGFTQYMKISDLVDNTDNISNSLLNEKYWMYTRL